MQGNDRADATDDQRDDDPDRGEPLISRPVIWRVRLLLPTLAMFVVPRHATGDYPKCTRWYGIVSGIQQRHLLVCADLVDPSARYHQTMQPNTPFVSNAEHWATYPKQPRPVQLRMEAAERLRRLEEAAKAAQTGQ